MLLLLSGCVWLFSDPDKGILDAKSAEAVLICGEQITINERRERTDAQLAADFEDVLAQRTACYPAGR